MKTLSIRQPWASLICHGVKDVENRTWKTDYRGKVLIHTGVTKVPKNIDMQMPPHMWSEVFMYMLQGDGFPETGRLPYGAIIGYATLVDCIEGPTDSIWDGGEEAVKWLFKDAYLFDKPIMGVKGKLNLYETPEITEENLPPATKMEHKVFWAEGKTLCFCTYRDFYHEIVELDFQWLEGYLANSVNDVFTVEGGDPFEAKQYKQLRVICDGEQAEIPIRKVHIEPLIDANTDEPIHYPLPNGEEFYWRLYAIELDR